MADDPQTGSELDDGGNQQAGSQGNVPDHSKGVWPSSQPHLVSENGITFLPAQISSVNKPPNGRTVAFADLDRPVLEPSTFRKVRRDSVAPQAPPAGVSANSGQGHSHQSHRNHNAAAVSSRSFALCWCPKLPLVIRGIPDNVAAAMSDSPMLVVCPSPYVRRRVCVISSSSDVVPQVCALASDPASVVAACLPSRMP